MKGNFESIINNEVPVVIDVYADWCSPCKIQSPILQELAGELKDKVKIIKIDADKNPEISSKYEIRSIPTIMIFKKGQLRYKNAGIHSKAQLMSIIEGNL
jgi:thioredoxin 1